MKGNVMIRMISMMIWVPILLAHFTGQIDLSHAYWLWLTLFAGANAFQATFTGFCPVSRFMPKDPETGACCASDTSGTCCSGTDEKSGESAKAASEPTKAVKTEEPSSCCGQCNSSEDEAGATDGKNGVDALVIKVLGSGCANCVTTAQLIQATADEANVEVTILKVEDVADITGYGVMSTPGIVIAEKVVHSGSVPSKEAIQGWLK